MKSLEVALFFSLLFGFVACNWVDQPKSINERQPLDLMGMTKLEVRGIAGNFSVLKGKSSFLSVQGVGRVAFTVQRTGSTLQVATTGDTNCYPCTVDIEIQLEQELELALTASNGNVTVTNAATTANLKSGNGAIRISGAASVMAKTSNGEIFASNLNGSVNLSSSNGKITLEKTVLPVSSQNLISTGNGDIRVQGVSTAGGFVINGNRGSPSFGLTGFELLSTANGFTATRVGANPTTLGLETNNGTIQISP
jgi:hypothetical protein